MLLSESTLRRSRTCYHHGSFWHHQREIVLGTDDALLN